MNIFLAPFLNGLVAFYQLFGNLGWAVVAMTALIRLLLLPLVFPSLKSAEKMKELKPKLDKLKKKYGDKKEQLAKAQMDLYKNEGINPLSGCLPQVLQILILILFYSAFRMLAEVVAGGGNLNSLNESLLAGLRLAEDQDFATNFLGNDLTSTPSLIFKQGVGINLVLPLILLIGSAGLQFLTAKMMNPAPEIEEKVAEKTKDTEDDMAVAMRNQSTYMMPLMTLVLGWNFNLGILLYWFVNSAMMVGQQMLVKKRKG